MLARITIVEQFTAERYLTEIRELLAERARHHHGEKVTVEVLVEVDGEKLWAPVEVP